MTYIVQSTTDGEAITEAFLKEPNLINTAGEMSEWVASPGNVALTDGQGNYGLFTYHELPCIYTGHYMFASAHGKEALSLARAMLRHMFTEYGARVIRGLTPASNKPACWITRKLGFVSHGTVEIEHYGPCYIFTLTPDGLTTDE